MTTPIKARPTLYKGIQMRSRLEADYAADIDKSGWTWAYEPTCFASSDGQWLPDFRLGKSEPFTYVELKPASLLREDAESARDCWARIDQILKRMTIAWASEPDAWLELAFWTYGATRSVLSIYGHQGHPWITDSYSEPWFPQIWPGMGQMERLRTRHLEAS